MRFLTMLGVLAALATSTAHANDYTLPEIGNEDFSVQPWGWTWASCENDSCKLSMVRLRGTFDTSSRWGGMVEFDFTTGARSDNNWVRQVYVSYDVSDDVSINIGRLFLAAPRATPPPFLLQTARYMRYPVSAFGWGVQFDYKNGPLSVLWDVTGDTSRRFSEGAQFGRIDTSVRATYALSDKLTIGGTFQGGEAFSRFGLEATWQPGDRHLVNVVGYTTERTEGGWAYYQFEVSEQFSLHGRIDLQEGSQSRTLFGVSADAGHGIYFVADYEFETEGVFARLRHRF